MAVALYARVSTSKQAEKELSISDQLRQMRDWCKRRGFAIGARYVEPGASATDDRRPVFQQMIADSPTLTWLSSKLRQNPGKGAEPRTDVPILVAEASKSQHRFQIPV